jgi:phosphatidylserine/phosphatidylglycerophosphate/cardiolipin synthase-like enzyme
MRHACIAVVRATALLSTLWVATGCGLNRPLARQADALVAQTRPTMVNCAREDRCAIDSPYRQLVENARAASTSETPVHYVNVLEHGEDSLLLRVHLIRAAQKSIDIQTFIWAEDASGWLMLDELIAAAKRGVRVRVLVDQLFSLDDVEWLSRIASAHANLEFRLYNPTFDEAVTQPLEFAAGLLCCFSSFNQRMHNKLFLVDGDIGIAGGRNVEDRYFDWDQEFDYRDRDVLVLGPDASAEMRASFEEFWANRRAVPLTRLNDVNQRIVADAGKVEALAPPATIDWPRVESLRARALDAGYIRAAFVDDALRVGHIEYFSDAPGKPAEEDGAGEALSEHVAELLRGAQSEIVFETPYLVLSKRARSIFRDLYKREPRVRVTVSTNSLAATDAFYVYALSHKYKKRYLKRYGFHIFEFKPFPGDAEEFVRDYATLAGSGNLGKYERYGQTPLKRHGVRLGLHAKSLVIDDSVSMIGSHNFDPRSDNYNTESGFIIHDREVAERVRAAVLRNTEPQNAWVIAKRQRPRLVDKANNAISDLSTALPLFDFWPFRYATSFELKPGCDPLPRSDPRFYECYEDVGDFPEVDLPMKTI